MLDRRHPTLAVTAATAFLLVASGAAADPVNTFTGAAAPSHVKPATSASYTVGLTNDPSSPEAADRAKVAVPLGFVVDGPSVQATASATGACQPSTWVADGDLIADGKINLTRPGSSPSDELCPGATLTVVFTATSAGSDGTYVWVSELLRGIAPFALAGPQLTVQVDGTGPEVSITSSPGSLSNQDSPTFEFTADEASTLECKLDDEPFGACASPRSYAGLDDGAHTFVVKATDPAGNTGQATHDWTIDATEPTTTITGKPDDPSNESSPSFAFAADEPAEAECNLDGAGFEPCSSPQDYTGLADGSHTFAVRATDPAGNSGPAASHGWTIDTTGPTVSITGKPNLLSNADSANFEFSADVGTQFECKLDGGTFAACSSPKVYTDLGEGSHKFAVRATDALGNVGSEASYQWTADTIAPAVEIAGAPDDPSSDSSPTFAFTAGEPAQLECKFDSAAFAVCASPTTYEAVGDGPHAFSVRATDPAGNAAQASHGWTVDTVAPTTTITEKPGNPSNDSSPSFAFTTSEPANAECNLDGAGFEPCSSSRTYSGLTDGDHTFAVRATDPAGNVRAESTYTWTIDTTAPTAQIANKPRAPSNESSPTFTFTAGEPGSFACKLDSADFTPCGSSQSFEALGDGSHTIFVRATDLAGNTGLAVSYVWTIDTVAPTASITGKPNDPSNLSSPIFVFIAGEPSTLACQLDGAAVAPCLSNQAHGPLGDGVHTFSVRATDLAGNVGTEATHMWRVDTVAPVATIADKPSNPSSDSSPTFAFSSDEAGTFACKLDDGGFTSCESPETYTGLADGAHRFSVRATDAASNTGAEATYTWIVDTGVPIAEITHQPGDPSNDGSPSFVFDADEPAQFHCSLDGETFLACFSPQTYLALAAGPHEFAVKATDLAGNSGPAETYTWWIDVTAPTTEIAVKPGDPSNDTSPTFSFTASEIGSQFTCKLDEDPFQPCTSPKTFEEVPDGSHTFSVRATDPATNTGTAQTYTWTIDTAAPAASITQKPAERSNDSSPSFGFTADEPGSSFECRLDGGIFTPCVSAKSYAGLGDDSHTFEVRATDAAGNAGGAASHTWVVDTIRPVATITDPPADPTNDGSPTFTFGADEPAQFQCKVDAAEFELCSSPQSYPSLPDGSHTFVVKAVDLAGNPSVEADFSWVVDTVAPTAAISSQPSNPSNNISPSFSFAANEAGATFICKLDEAAFDGCSSPAHHTGLLHGEHTFAVRATDAAGNTGPAVTYGWTIDSSAPTAEITDKPGNPSRDDTPSFAFGASQLGSMFLCKLDADPFASCSSPFEYPIVGDGSHTFVVKATDPAGNTSAETSYTWTIDTVAPASQLTAKPKDPSNDSSPSFSFTAGEQGSTFVCKLDGAASGPCSSPRDLEALGQGEHTFSVRATDPAGNEGAPASHTWRIDTTEPATTLDGPAGLTNLRSASFTFSAPEPSTFECRLGGGAFERCASPKNYPDLGDGSHTFTVRAMDAAGNTGLPSARTWSIDATAPTPTIGQKPGNPSNDSSPTFAFGAGEPAVFTCKLDPQPAAPCSGSQHYLNVGQGTHTFTLSATDTAGNTGEASFTWRIDITPPTATIAHKPANPSKAALQEFAFSSNESDVVFSCRIELGGYDPCGSTKSYSLVEGPHDFAVRATDAAGNTGASALYSWTIDRTSPTTTITGKPGNPSNNPSPSFSFAAGENATFVCRLDGSEAPCTSPASYSGLADGPHAFSVRATDVAGNTGAETSNSWTIETRAPSAALTSGPPGLTNTSAASFRFSADEPSSFDCNVDDRGFEPCSSPATYHGLVDGAHTFTVRARDAVGNLSANVTHVWTIDTTAPETTVVSAPKSGSASSATFAFAASEGATFECRLNGAAFALCSSPKGYSGLSKATHQFEVRAVDAAGNADTTPAIHAWTIKAAAVKLARSALMAPSAGARVTKPPLLVWRRATRARYYNVQVYRGPRKVLTAWPTQTKLQLKAKWTNLGRKERLLLGSYRWYVWPGYGAPSARRYGQLLGQSTFVVARRSGR